jgi:hypothetical protein
MRPTDIFLFLIGNRGAIQRIASSWWSLLIAALLVITGGIARNYDHLDLLHNPEWLYGPFVASAITSICVFIFLYPYLKLRKVSRGMSYPSFMCIYWMTAPCAWLYAIPVEATTDLITATQWNIAFLAIVSIWRVFLMIRALMVLTGAGLSTCLIGVLFPASGIMCIGSFFKGISLVGIMGGVRLPPHTELLVHAAKTTSVFSFMLTLILGALWLGSLHGRRAVAVRPLPWRKEPIPSKTILCVTLLILLSLLASIPIQRKVQRNHHLDSLITNKQYSEAVKYASPFKRDDFSSIHYLPPDPYQLYTGGKHHYAGLLNELVGQESTWLREIWTAQYVEALVSSRWGVSDHEIRVIRQFPEIQEMIQAQPDSPLKKRLLIDLETPLTEDPLQSIPKESP